ncbi:hypothetical protein, partial [Actinopolymorpha pittospori]|uniref:hypothetical protein n=1 Tax=Actinopolymorpha pittospori TaxID=648752 RepID=UPI0031F0D4BD
MGSGREVPLPIDSYALVSVWLGWEDSNPHHQIQKAMSPLYMLLTCDDAGPPAVSTGIHGPRKLRFITGTSSASRIALAEAGLVL